jgi:simple sugar transport system ATP-binding protein
MGAVRRDAEALMDRFDVRPRDLDRAVGTMSGGNVQKLVVARELSREPKLIVACYPSMGLDVAAAAAVLSALVQAAALGAAVVWISEDLEALLAHADRIGVLFKGTLRGPIAAEGASREQLGAWMTGAAA